MKNSWLLGSMCVLLGVVACQTENPEDVEIEQDITRQLDKQEHVRGSLNPFKLIENPQYKAAREIDFLSENDFVFITKVGGDLLVYPHRYMNVEVVNDEVNGIYMAVTYCPLTRSGINWNRVVGIDTLLLTASGYLYKENLMPLDVNSGNIWSQMLMRRFHGDANLGEIFASRELNTFPMIETTWKTVKDYFPEASVYLYDIDMKSTVAAPLEQELGIISNEAVQTYSLELFPGEIELHQSLVIPEGMIVVAGSEDYHYMLAFRTNYIMEPVEGAFPVIMKDESGTLWNIFGEGVNGDHHGETLESPLYFTAADWAWRDLYDQVQAFDPG